MYNLNNYNRQPFKIPTLNKCIVKPKSKVQSPKVKTERTWAETKITWK